MDPTTQTFPLAIPLATLASRYSYFCLATSASHPRSRNSCPSHASLPCRRYATARAAGPPPRSPRALAALEAAVGLE